MESLGLLNGLARGAQYDPHWLLHDVLAYPLVGAVACAAAAEPAERLRRVSWLVILLGAISLVLQSAAAASLFHVPSMMPWYWDRLRGWSANPNQLAFLCTALVLLAVHLIGTAASFASAAAAIACALLSLVVGRLTGSDTFTLMLVVASTLLLLLKLRFRTLQSGPHLEARVAVGLVLAVGLPLLAVSVAPLVMAARSANGDLGAGVLKNGGKDAAAEADLRFALWQQAVQRGVDFGHARARARTTFGNPGNACRRTRERGRTAGQHSASPAEWRAQLRGTQHCPGPVRPGWFGSGFGAALASRVRISHRLSRPVSRPCDTCSAGSRCSA